MKKQTVMFPELEKPPARVGEEWTQLETDRFLVFLFEQDSFSKRTLREFAVLESRSFDGVERHWDELRYNDKNARSFDYQPSSLRSSRTGRRFNVIDQEFVRAHREGGVPAAVTARILMRPVKEVQAYVL